MITVGLPVWQGKEIVWLAMESLLRQETTEPWELIIAEEQADTAGDYFYRGYEAQLSMRGCVRVVYHELTDHPPLNKKWLGIIARADSSSIGLIMQSADCYSEPHRIQRTVEILRDGADWIQQRRGLFYHIETRQGMIYDHALNEIGHTALNMAMSLPLARKIETVEDKWRGVDGWLLRQMQVAADKQRRNARVFMHDEPRWRQGVDTHGRNRISKGRVKYFDKVTAPFRQADMKLSDAVPADIYDRLLAMAAVTV